MKKLGLIVNPVAGMGGRVGLKGSDGVEILRKARQLGAQAESPKRAVTALKVIAQLNDDLHVLTYPQEMGRDPCREAGLPAQAIGKIRSDQTTAEDTLNAAHEMVAAQVDLLLFAGGDGTARNVYDAVGQKLPALGIPAGVKIHSAVYAVTPKIAGQVASMFLQGRLMNMRDAEVMDLDEEAFRSGIVAAKLYGYLRVPEENRYVQSVKAGGVQAEQESLRAIAAAVIRQMDDSDDLFVIGPGTTTRVIMESLELENTLLGVDVVRRKQLLGNDVTESQLLKFIKRQRAKIIVTLIGGQGHIFGRGNQQLSPRVIREVGIQNITIIATKDKLASLCGRPLLVDTGDEQLNDDLSGYLRVTTGLADEVMYKVGF